MLRVYISPRIHKKNFGGGQFPPHWVYRIKLSRLNPVLKKYYIIFNFYLKISLIP